MKIPQGWWVVGTSDGLGKKQVRQTMAHGVPIVLFRDENRAVHALLDRCAHRNVPLSRGKIEQGQIECPYHGWRFDGHGACVNIPNLLPSEAAPAFRVPAFSAVEAQGYVWVSCAQETSERFELPSLPPPYQKVAYEFELESTLDQALENQLDVTHTSVLHAGLFRKASHRQKIVAQVTESDSCVQVEYVGEKRPTGLISKLLSPGNGEVKHIDRLYAPAITQVEYRLGRTHFLATTLLTPTHSGKIKCYSIVWFRLWIPALLVKPFVALSTKTILKQDVDLLKIQKENVDCFGQPSFVSTKLDFYAGLIRKTILGSPSKTQEVEKKYSIEMYI